MPWQRPWPRDPRWRSGTGRMTHPNPDHGERRRGRTCSRGPRVCWGWTKSRPILAWCSAQSFLVSFPRDEYRILSTSASARFQGLPNTCSLEVRGKLARPTMAWRDTAGRVWIRILVSHHPHPLLPCCASRRPQQLALLLSDIRLTLTRALCNAYYTPPQIFKRKRSKLTSMTTCQRATRQGTSICCYRQTAGRLTQVPSWGRSSTGSAAGVTNCQTHTRHLSALGHTAHRGRMQPATGNKCVTRTHVPS